MKSILTPVVVALSINLLFGCKTDVDQQAVKPADKNRGARYINGIDYKLAVDAPVIDPNNSCPNYWAKESEGFKRRITLNVVNPQYSNRGNISLSLRGYPARVGSSCASYRLVSYTTGPGISQPQDNGNGFTWNVGTLSSGFSNSQASMTVEVSFSGIGSCESSWSVDMNSPGYMQGSCSSGYQDGVNIVKAFGM